MNRLEAAVDYRETPHGNALANIVEQKIQENGPLPFDQYMSHWLYGGSDRAGFFHPGFYNHESVRIGNSLESDFTTPAEQTPLYGYVMGNQIIEMWKHMDYPDNFKVVEMGGGNGTLASDILHRLDQVGEEGEHPKDPRQIEYVLLEQSPVLIARQKERLSKFEDRAQFVRGRADAPPLRGITGIFLSVELPDAFPVHVVRKIDDRVEECFVGAGSDSHFRQLWGPPTEEVKAHVEEYRPPLDSDPSPVNLNAESWMKSIAGMLDQGFVITVDYDASMDCPQLYTRKDNRAVFRDGNPVFSKKNIGKIDMTTGIDFQMLSDVGKQNGLKTMGYVKNGGFLFGQSYDSLVRRFSHGEYIGDRQFDGINASSLARGEAHYVLMQSKGVGEADFQSLKYEVNYDLDRHYREFRGISF